MWAVLGFRSSFPTEDWLMDAERFYRVVRTLVRYLAGTEDPPQTRLSREEAVGLARAAAERAGLALDESFGSSIYAEARREGKARRVVWVVMMSYTDLVGYDAPHVRVKIDDATGEVIEVGRFGG